MAYYNGTVNSLHELLTSLSTALTANGWEQVGNLFSKGECQVLLNVADISKLSMYQQWVLQVIGHDGNSSALFGHCLGDMAVVYSSGQYIAQGLSFPAEYHLFLHDNPDEVYCIVNYNVDYYQWIAFGKSVMSLEGSGVWCGGTFGAPAEGSYSHLYRWPMIAISASGGGGGNADLTSAGLFWTTSYLGSDAKPSSGSINWASGTWRFDCRSCTAISQLLAAQPSPWNDEAMLISIKPIVTVTENKVLQVAEIQHARYLRIDNYEPKDVIVLGTERWMVFPFYRKNVAERNGGGDIDHTGTFGWAIRYDGP